jgi:hypothetical protein
LLLGAGASADGLCNAADPRPCWRETPTGFRYLDRDLTPDGLFKITLREGADGEPRITIKGKGVLLDMPNLDAVTRPITVQFKNSDGICWEAVFP